MPSKKEFTQAVNMPQMALSGLSESWLMKEIGDCHWHMLCEDLGLKSNEILDEFSNRLYASFVRIKFESSSYLKEYCENDMLNFSGEVQSFGPSLYFSQIDVSSNNKAIKCSLATSFSTRVDDADNSKLTKGVPAKSKDDAIVKVTAMPQHILDIVKLKKNTINKISLSNHDFNLTDDFVHEVQYKINPYTDINGVGLLYFAAYPIINDICEYECFNGKKLANSNWALASSTMSRDVFYFGNCNIDDTITYKVNSHEIINKNQIAIQSSLYRQCTNTLIAKIFTIKHFG